MKEYARSAFLIAFPALLFGGCISIDPLVMNPATHGYSGPDRPLEELAVVVVFNPGGIQISSIQGPAGPVAEAALLERAQNPQDSGISVPIHQVHLPPGHYTLNCGYVQAVRGAPTRDQLFGDPTTGHTFPVRADLRAGQVYLLGKINGTDESSPSPSPESYLNVRRMGTVQELAPALSEFHGAHEWKDLNQRMSAASLDE